MHVCIVVNAHIPAFLYGGTERVVVWPGRAHHAIRSPAQVRKAPLSDG